MTTYDEPCFRVTPPFAREKPVPRQGAKFGRPGFRFKVCMLDKALNFFLHCKLPFISVLRRQSLIAIPRNMAELKTKVIAEKTKRIEEARMSSG